MATEKNTADREYDLTGELTEDLQYIKIDHALAFKRLFSVLAGHTLRVRFSIFRYVRSDAQNRYCWGVIVPMVRVWYKETNGETKTPDWIYGYLRTDVLDDNFIIEDLPSGKQVITMTGKRFSKMNTKEFALAVDIIRAEMLLRGCDIPEPRKHNFLGDFLEDN